MTINRAIELLLAMRDKHGDIEVLFDCPYCGKSARPTVVVPMVVVQAVPTR